MAQIATNQYTLDFAGKSFAVATESAGLSTNARLFVDGVQIDEKKSANNRVKLEGGGLTVVVYLNWLGHVTQILAVSRGTDPKRAEEEGLAFAPPPGSRAAKLEELRRTHPELYAARHILGAIAQVAIGVLGIGALLWAIFGALLPRISIPLPPLPAIPWPVIDIDIDLPNIPWPDIPLPVIVVPEPILTFLRSLGPLFSMLDWIIPIVIATFVAINEVRKRRKRDEAQRRREGEHPPQRSAITR
jgi:hypothetical protein